MGAALFFVGTAFSRRTHRTVIEEIRRADKLGFGGLTPRD